MQALLQPLSKLGEYEEIKNRIEKNRGILQLAGCIDSCLLYTSPSPRDCS